MNGLTQRLRQVGRLAVFLLWYVGELLKANLAVMRDILGPGNRIRPAFLEVPLRCRTELEITTISNLITLTPGTVTVSVQSVEPTIWVHGMHVHDLEAFRAGLHDMEGRMLRAMRLDPDPGPVPRRATPARVAPTGGAPTDGVHR